MQKSESQKKELIRTIFLLILCIFSVGRALALPLISETDFSVAEGTNDYYSVEMTDGFVNSKAIPHISVESIPLADGTESTETKSDFLDEPHYAITPNPIRLDNLRLEDNGGGLIFSAGKGTKKITDMIGMEKMMFI